MYKSHAKVPAPQTLVYSLLYIAFISALPSVTLVPPVQRRSQGFLTAWKKGTTGKNLLNSNNFGDYASKKCGTRGICCTKISFESVLSTSGSTGQRNWELP